MEITYLQSLNRELIQRKTPLQNRIRIKGMTEQERQLLFPSVLGSRAITKGTSGKSKTHHRRTGQIKGLFGYL